MAIYKKAVGVFMIIAGACTLFLGVALVNRSVSDRRYLTTCVEEKETGQVKRGATDVLRKIEKAYHELASFNHVTENKNDKVYQAFQTFMKEVKLSLKSKGKAKLKKVTCPDEYHGAKSDYPDYLTNWKVTTCPYSLPISSLVTFIIVHMKNEDHTKLESVIAEVGRQYIGVEIIVGTDHPPLKDLSGKYPSLRFAVRDQSRVKLWSLSLDMVTTPFVFIGRDFGGFGHLSNFTRVLHVLSESEGVEVVSFGTLNPERVWNVDCYQLTLDLYEFRLIPGYKSSFNECTVCQYVDGSFLSKKATIARLGLDESLGEDMAFLDFFLRLGKEETSFVSCPDVMVHNTRPKPTFFAPKDAWLPFIRKNEINVVIISGIRRHEFSCSESGMTCNVYYYVNNGLNIPICCVKAFERLLQDFVEFCNKYNMHCEIDTGTVLAAVKLNHPMPWDLDLDAGFHKDNISVFVSHKNELENRGYAINMDKTVHALGMRYRAPELAGLHMDIWTYRPNISYGNVQYGVYKPTRIQFGDFLVNVPYNPGLFARNRYGKEIYKHSHSWVTLGRSTSYANYHGGEMVLCKIKGHHACMDRSLPDGNVKYVLERN